MSSSDKKDNFSSFLPVLLLDAQGWNPHKIFSLLAISTGYPKCLSFAYINSICHYATIIVLKNDIDCHSFALKVMVHHYDEDYECKVPTTLIPCSSLIC